MITELAPGYVLRREWQRLPLSEGLIRDVQPGFACGNHNRDGDGLIHVRPFNVSTNGNMDFSSVKFIPRAEAHKPERLLQRDDIVFNNTNSPELVGKTALYQEQDERAFSNHMTRLRVNPDRLRPAFLAMALHQLWREGYFADKCNNHVSQASISRSVLLEAEIPIPPLADQDSLVDQVRAAQSKLDIAHDRLATIPALLKKFRQSVLATACSGQLTADWRTANNERESGHKLAARMTAATPDKKLRSVPKEPDLELPATWKWAAIGNIAAIRGGIQKQPHRAPKSNAYPYLRVANVLRNRLDLRDLSLFELAPGELETYRLESGDLLVVEGNGSFSEIGRASIWRDEVPDCVHQNHIIRVRFNGLVPEFVNCFWNSPIGIEQVTATAVTTSGLFSLSTGKIASLMIPVPGKDEQIEIVSRVESLFALADSIESRLADATAQVERTTQAILAKAFRGEL
ncbi:MAG: restriction endonuclease subunit S [Fimbriimonadaceae bacterium]|nr:restriction endonuclease subunit S [Fimbriimonadaceae bacterium]QYK59128.1 MAG: restriction endonuclease subunit S [Fimbriimonadaceae bacterium]